MPTFTNPIDARILIGINYNSKGRNEICTVKYYCLEEDDLDELEPKDFGETADWAIPYCRSTPRVYDWKTVSVVPGFDVPCYLTITSMTRLPGSYYSKKNARISLKDQVIRRYLSEQKYWLPKYFGIKTVTLNDIAGVVTLGGVLLNRQGNVASAGDEMFINANQDTGTWLGSQDTTNSPLGAGASAFDPDDYLGKRFTTTVYYVKFYDKISKIDKYAVFKGVNKGGTGDGEGQIPKKYAPYTTTAQKWKVVKNKIKPVVDEENKEWTQVERWMSLPPGDATWANNTDYWTWRSP